MTNPTPIDPVDDPVDDSPDDLADEAPIRTAVVPGSAAGRRFDAVLAELKK